MKTEKIITREAASEIVSRIEVRSITRYEDLFLVTIPDSNKNFRKTEDLVNLVKWINQHEESEVADWDSYIDEDMTEVYVVYIKLINVEPDFLSKELLLSVKN